MSDLFSSLLIFTIIKTISSTFFFAVSKFYKNPQVLVDRKNSLCTTGWHAHFTRLLRRYLWTGPSPLFLEHRFFFHVNNILQLSMYHWIQWYIESCKMLFTWKKNRCNKQIVVFKNVTHNISDYFRLTSVSIFSALNNKSGTIWLKLIAVYKRLPISGDR
jgi:hypothetical protein